MGRTNPTYRDVLDRVEDDWAPFRRGLRQQDQNHFDDLFVQAHQHADAAGLQNPTTPFRAVLLSICLEQQKTIHDLEQRIEALEPNV